jgi:hypothetical protein
MFGCLIVDLASSGGGLGPTNTTRFPILGLSGSFGSGIETTTPFAGNAEASNVCCTKVVPEVGCGQGRFGAS